MHVPRIDPKGLGQRIAHYATLRAAERAITPTVRGRTQLPSYRLGRELLDSLQQLREAAQRGASKVDGVDVDELAACIDRDLDRFGNALASVIEQTPMVQIRAILPGTVAQAREEVEGLLDFCLAPDRFRHWPRALVDYAITLLACETREDGRRVVRHDPSQITRRVAALARVQAQRCDPEIDNACERLRAASVDLLAMDDLESIIRRMRAVKDDLGERLLHPEVLRNVVAYNVATHNRLLVILSAAREFDRAAHLALATLRALDRAA